MTAEPSAAAPDAGTFRRLHPLTPVLRGWKVFAAVVAVALQQMYGDVSPGYLFLAIAASIPVGIAYGWLSWRRTHFRVGRDDLRLETGVLFRRSRQVRLDRLQAVDVVRPLVARALGLAELRLEVAGGSSSEAPLAYLSEPAAQQLRAELLARAAGLDHGSDPAPVAPERVLLTVPLGRLVEAQLRTGGLIGGLVAVVVMVVVAGLSGEVTLLGLALPFLLVAVPAGLNGVVGQFDFTVAESPDGLRLRRGLLETRSQTVPPGRVQAVRVVEPLLWRSRGWVRVEANVAGYVGEGQQRASVLAPVATRDEAARLLALVLPGLDTRQVVPQGVPRRARWLDPLQWRSLAVGSDDRFLLVRRGRWRRETDLLPHEKVQSVRISQGAVQRRLRLATLHVDTTPGPVAVVAAHRDAADARALLDAEVAAARAARAVARPDRWMQSPGGPGRAYRDPVRPPHRRTDAGLDDEVVGHGISSDASEVADVVGHGVPSAGPEPLDLGGEGFLDDPYPALAALRSRSPVVWHDQTGQWLALSYEHANQVLRDRKLGRLWTDRQPADRFAAFNDLHRNQMMENEPPVHTRLRSLVAKSFARGHVERLRPRVAQMTTDLLDAVDPAGFDLIADYAEPLPVAIVAELLGVPEEDRHLLRPWSQAIVAMYEYGRTPEAEERAITASVEFAAYMRGLADERRARPREDLVSHLAAEEQAGERLTGDELVASAILLLNAGHEASVNGFGNGMVALMDHPDDLARLRAAPELVEPAVEELLRFDSPLQLFERTAKEDVVVGGVTVEAGTRIAALLGSANRDPAAFPEPDRLDLARRPNQHLSFGAGLHHCLGAPLARMELQTALPTLLGRFPSLEPAGKPVRRPTFVLRGYSSVPVRG